MLEVMWQILALPNNFFVQQEPINRHQDSLVVLMRTLAIMFQAKGLLAKLVVPWVPIREIEEEHYATLQNQDTMSTRTLPLLKLPV